MKNNNKKNKYHKYKSFNNNKQRNEKITELYREWIYKINNGIL